MARSRGKKSENKAENIEGKTIKAHFTGEQVFSNDKEAIDLHGKSRFGEMHEGKVYYSSVEALYLIEKKKLDLYEGRKKITFDKFINTLKKKDDRIQTKYNVFKDMRNRGYIVKTALKFGAEFRVYDKGISPGEDHAKWILYPVNENSGFTWHDFSAKNRVAHSTKKNLLIGIVDEEGDVTYYEISWVRP
ncbi:tRNA-intron lyase [Candidatus Pacearchaeota archaeon]|nr:tRNA-intron lyase [Candidatus Pacearchaeota archaeon]